MEKIKWNNLPERDLPSWFLIAAISKNDKYWDKMKDHELDPAVMEVILTINGVDLPFMKVMEDLTEQLDQMVAEKAAEIIRDITNISVNEIVEASKTLIRKVYDHLGIEKKDSLW